MKFWCLVILATVSLSTTTSGEMTTTTIKPTSTITSTSTSTTRSTTTSPATSTTGSTRKPSEDCVKGCSEEVGDFNNWRDADSMSPKLRSLLNWTIISDDFITLCDNYARYVDCLSACTDETELSSVIDIFKPLKEACSSKEAQNLTDALKCVEWNKKKIRDNCSSNTRLLTANVLPHIEVTTYKHHIMAPKPYDSKVFSKICGYGACFIEDANTACANISMTAWNQLTLGFIQPAVSRRNDFYISDPEYEMPEKCKSLMEKRKDAGDKGKGNGGRYASASSVKAVIVTIGLVKIFGN